MYLHCISERFGYEIVRFSSTEAATRAKRRLERRGVRCWLSESGQPQQPPPAF